MSLFNALLQNIKRKIDTENAYKDIVIQALKEILGITIGVDDIVSLKEGVLTLQTQPTRKSAILLKKDKILAYLNDNNISVQTIR